MDGKTGLSPGYLLHHRPYGNTSLLVECFTAAQGRFPAIAKGARSGRSRGTLQPFRPLLLAALGRGEVRTLAQWEPDQAIPPLEGEALYCGFYLNELLMRLLGRDDPHPGLFLRYHRTLVGLANRQETEPLLRRFEVELLAELGYGLLLEQEADGGEPVEPGRRYRFRLEQGPQAAGLNEPGALAGSTLLALAGRIPFEGEGLREARDLMRRVLRHYLGERPLKSRELFRGRGER